jgi:hypothetical protein
MRQQTGMTSTQTLAGKAGRVRVASSRVMTGHAALALGISSTFIFVSSAIFSFVTSYDQWAGREKLTLMLIGLLLPLLLAVIVRSRIETVIGILGVGIGLAAPLIGVAGMTLAAVDKGAAAGNLAVLAPLAGCGLVWAMARQNQILLGVLGVCLAAAAGMVFVSGEHAAMLGLAVGVTIGFGYFWRHRIAEQTPALRIVDAAVVALAVLFLSLYLLLILMPDRVGPVAQVLPRFYAERFAAWRDTPALIGDYFFTGSGLGAAPMVISSYLFLVHVPYFHHVHNLFLQVGIEQGVLGILGLGGMFFAAFWSMAIAMRRAHAYVALCAASVFASLLSLFVSGLFESDVYAGGWVVVMFFSFGFAWVIAQYDVAGRASRRGGLNRPHWGDMAIGALPLVLAVILFLWPANQGRWTANWGAVAQNKAELTGFRFPLTLIQDELRRSPRIELDPAITLYREALMQDRHNVTALRRLAQIEISRGEYAAALPNLERAYQTVPGQRATRQLLGELYAIDGRLDEATALWQTIGVAPELLKNRLWWYEHIGEQQAADNIRTVLHRLGI